MTNTTWLLNYKLNVKYNYQKYYVQKVQPYTIFLINFVILKLSINANSVYIYIKNITINQYMYFQ